MKKTTTPKKGVKTSKKLKKDTLVSFVLDQTGSMYSCRDVTISGFNEYVQTLKDKKVPGLRFSLALFNSEETEVRHNAVVINQVHKLNEQTYVPSAVTPLYDAIGQAIRAAEKKAKKNQAVLMVIMTDGYENASEEFTQKTIFSLVKEKEKAGWAFIYLGANQDAWDIGRTIGFRFGNVRTYDTGKTVGTFAALAMSNCAYAMASSTGDAVSNTSVLKSTGYDEALAKQKDDNEL